MPGLSDILGWFSSDLAIDLGTATTLVYVRGKGITLSEPSVVAIEKQSNTVLAVGVEAKRMVGRTPGNIVAIRPIKEGVIADFAMTERMLHYFITKAHNRRAFVRPRCIIGVPSRITEVEQRAVRESAVKPAPGKSILLKSRWRQPSVPGYRLRNRRGTW